MQLFLSELTDQLLILPHSILLFSVSGFGASLSPRGSKPRCRFRFPILRRIGIEPECLPHPDTALPLLHLLQLLIVNLRISISNRPGSMCSIRSERIVFYDHGAIVIYDYLLASHHLDTALRLAQAAGASGAGSASQFSSWLIIIAIFNRVVYNLETPPFLKFHHTR